jgi:hypothetical protein
LTYRKKTVSHAEICVVYLQEGKWGSLEEDGDQLKQDENVQVISSEKLVMVTVTVMILLLLVGWD